MKFAPGAAGSRAQAAIMPQRAAISNSAAMAGASRRPIFPAGQGWPIWLSHPDGGINPLMAQTVP
ncbi:MAG: hypothetical protein C0605_12690 [Hyphomicrobiales bacterium]|nr:MAG: hypothetical protein C0605_12690 [Hyphomicrobiales bacterium]